VGAGAVPNAVLRTLLAVQPLETVRPAYAVAVLAAAAAILAGAMAGVEAPALRIFALVAMLLGLIALSLARLSPWLGAAVAGVAAAAAGLAVDLPPDPRAARLAALGSCLGIALTVLLVWGAVDLACRRVGTVAGAVAGSWVAAIGLMTAVLPG
jgi:hypothetical protein